VQSARQTINRDTKNRAIMGDTSGNNFVRYLFAVVAVVLAVVLRLLLDPLLNERLPFITLFAAVTLMAWHGGRGPAVLTLVLGSAAITFFVLEPRYSLAVERPEYVVGLLFYAAINVGSIVLFEQLRSTQRRAEENAVEARQNYQRLEQETKVRQEAEAGVIKEGERLRVTLASIGDAVITTDSEGRVAFLNDVAQQLTGWTQQDAKDVSLEKFFQIVNEATRQPVENPALRSLREGKVIGLANHTVLIAKDGTERPIDDSAAPIRDHHGNIFGSVLVFRDITERRQAEQALNERVRLLSLNAAVGKALVQGNGLGAMLRQCSEALVKHLDGEFARIWMLNEAEGILELRASAGMYTHLDGPHSRVPVGQYKIGLIAQQRKPHLTNEVADDPRVGDQEWAKREGMTAFAGYPLVVDDQLVGVMAMFARQPLSEATLEAMASVADEIAVGIERKATQERLHEHREWLRVTLASIGDAVIATDTQGRVTFLNGVAADLTGWKPEKAQGQPLEAVFRIVNEQARQPVENPVEKVLREGVVVGLANHTVLIARDGTERPIDDSAAPIRDGSGQMIGVVLIFRDVTEQRRAEQELRQSETELSDFFENATVGLHWVGPDGIILRANQAELNMLGYSREEYVGRSIADFHADQDVICDILKQLQAGKKLADYPARLRCKDGSLKDVLIDSSVLWRDGQFIHTRCFTRDVTQRKRSEQTARFLADASAALAVIVDFDSTLQKVASLAVPYFADWATVDLAKNDGTLRRVAVAHVDPGKVELAHELHRRFPPDPAAPQGVWNILRTGQAEMVQQITDELLGQAIQDKERLRIVRELGLKSYIGVPLKVRDKLLGVLSFIAAESGHLYDDMDLAVAKDLADRAAIAIENSHLYRELRDADRRKDEFLATLAHELRNPLAPIRNGLQILRLSGANDETVVEVHSIMERQLDQMIRLIDDLMDVSRITRNKLELKKQRMELAVVIQNAVETSRPLIDQDGHELSVWLPPDPVHLNADPTRLAQVFSNLLNNSAKYTEPGGRISLVAEVLGDEVAVRVRDNGVGIPAEAMPRLFQMFSQVDCNMERAQGGLGIGLTLVRRLAEMHGGRVEAHSDGPGKGSEFVVRLPVLKPDRVSSRTPATDDGPVAASVKRRILIVDDNHDSAMSLGMMLKLLGNETHTAHDGLSAVTAADQLRPDIILLDIGLPKLNGHDACRRIREQPWSNGTVIVALTGWGQEEDRRRSQEAGFNHHLVKPVEMAALEKLLGES
jgi:PAS domain S-box-containing protein